MQKKIENVCDFILLVFAVCAYIAYGLERICVGGVLMSSGHCTVDALVPLYDLMGTIELSLFSPIFGPLILVAFITSGIYKIRAIHTGVYDNKIGLGIWFFSGVIMAFLILAPLGQIIRLVFM